MLIIDTRIIGLENLFPDLNSFISFFEINLLLNGYIVVISC